MPHDTRQDTSEAVDALMATLSHPHHAGIQALRRCMADVDPQGLLNWLAADRAIVGFRDEAALAAKQQALQELLRAWIERV